MFNNPTRWYLCWNTVILIAGIPVVNWQTNGVVTNNSVIFRLRQSWNMPILFLFHSHRRNLDICIVYIHSFHVFSLVHKMGEFLLSLGYEVLNLRLMVFSYASESSKGKILTDSLWLDVSWGGLSGSIRREATGWNFRQTCDVCRQEVNFRLLLHHAFQTDEDSAYRR